MEPSAPTPDSRLRTSVSLPAKYVIAWELAKKRYPSANISSFSDFLSDAIVAYAEKHHPDLVADAVNQIEESPSTVTSHKFYNAKNPTGKKIRGAKKTADVAFVKDPSTYSNPNAASGAPQTKAKEPRAKNPVAPKQNRKTA